MKNERSISVGPMGAALLLAVLYVWIPTCNYNFDSLMYASIVEAGYTRAFVDTNRLFYTGFIRILYVLFQKAGIHLRAIDLLQGLSLISSVGILVLVSYWFKKYLNPLVSACLIALLGVSSAWWRFSTDPHSHMVSLLPLMGAVFFWLRWVETKEKINLLYSGLLWYTAIVFHESHVLMGAVFLLSSEHRRVTWKFIGIVAAGVLVSYVAGAALHQSLGSWREFIGFCLGKGKEKILYEFDPLVFGRTTLRSLFLSPWSLLFLAAAGLGFRVPALHPRLRLVACWVAVYFVFFFFFEPINPYFRLFLLLPLVLLMGECLTRRPRLVGLFLSLAVLVQVIWELPFQRSSSRPANNPYLVQANALREQTNQGDAVVLTSEPDVILKFYISYFGLRTTIPVDHLFSTHQERAVAVIDHLFSQTLSRGSSLYFYENVLHGASLNRADQDVWRAYLQNWTFQPTPWREIFIGWPNQTRSPTKMG